MILLSLFSLKVSNFQVSFQELLIEAKEHLSLIEIIHQMKSYYFD